VSPDRRGPDADGIVPSGGFTTARNAGRGHGTTEDTKGSARAHGAGRRRRRGCPGGPPRRAGDRLRDPGYCAAILGPLATWAGRILAGITGGDPIDLATGLFTYDKTDLVLPDTLPIVLRRSYRQGQSLRWPFGLGLPDA